MSKRHPNYTEAQWKAETAAISYQARRVANGHMRTDHIPPHRQDDFEELVSTYKATPVKWI